MSQPAAIAGSLVDAKNIAVHKTVRLSIDIPAEQGAAVIAAFGWPTMAAPVAVAVARLNTGKEVVPDIRQGQALAESPDGRNKNGAGEKRSWSDLSLAQQAGIRCAEVAFQKFLRETGDMQSCNTADDAATYVRFICGVGSRREIENSLAARTKWQDLETRYQVWLQDVEIAR